MPEAAKFCPKDRCTGCGSCAAGCRALTMLPDECGFLRPFFTGGCRSCAPCTVKCPEGNAPVERMGGDGRAAFAAWNLNTEVRRRSSSGGIFYALAESVVGSGGVVFGAALDVGMVCRHQEAESREGLASLMGSKYVQSQTVEAFRKVKALLGAGRTVLFTGTPCQAAGLQAYLGGCPEGLITVDLLCHGVMSLHIWRKYVDFQTRRFAAPLRGVFFRDKSRGWARYSMRQSFANGKEYCEVNAEDPYLSLFQKNLGLRSSCHNCSYAGSGRVSDITLADYWGVERVHPELECAPGISLVLCNTGKGVELFGRLDGVARVPSDAGEAARFNHSLIRGVPPPDNRERFIADLQKLSFRRLQLRYVPETIAVLRRLRRAAARIMRIMKFKRNNANG